MTGQPPAISHQHAGVPLWAEDDAGDGQSPMPGVNARDTSVPSPARPRFTDDTVNGAVNDSLASDSLANDSPDTDTTLDVTNEADLCVIGLGGTGLAAVEAGLEAGLRVIGLDAGPIAGAAAGRNGGLLLAGMAAFHHHAVATHGHARALAWYRATMVERDRLIANDLVSTRRSGSLRVADDAAEARDLEAMATAMRTDDLPVEWAEHADNPALLFPDDAAGNPAQRCRRLASALVSAGAVLASHTPALRVEPGRVTTATGMVRAATIVVCVDGGLERVVPSLGARITSVRLQMVGTTPTSTVVPHPVYQRWGLDYWQQLSEDRLAVGGGRDHGGPAEDTAVAMVSPPVQQWLDQLVTQIAPDASITHRWAAIVGFTDDGIPICTQVDAGVWAVGGYSGTGNVIGPMLARELVAWSLVGHRSALLERLGLG